MTVAYASEAIAGAFFLEAYKHPEGTPIREVAENRGQPRYKIAVDITVHSRASGTLQGRTVDISESGVSAILWMEVPLGELVELECALPFGPLTIYAVVRQRNAFRYGFQFLESTATNHIIRSTCRAIAVADALNPPERG